MAQHSTEEKMFTCAACGEEYTRDAAVSECRMCRRTFCEECIDEWGNCTPCGQE
ncbi:MAG TPA: hypothetical protein PLM79_03180 [Syntrophobacteraceae bacterium]|nr:hypothetical protein [Syntrophobacteraceae bacterium]